MQKVPQFVLKRLQEAIGHSHPDADLLSAFAEQSLGKGERTRVLEHLTACGDCRDVVALSLPETEMVSAATSVGLAPNWLRWPTLRWGALAAGIIVVASAGVLEYSHRNQQQVAALNLSQSELPPPATSALSEAPSVQAGIPPTAMEKKALSATGPRRADKSARTGGEVLQADSKLNAAGRAGFAHESQVARAEQRTLASEAVERQAKAGEGSTGSAAIDRNVIAQNQIAPLRNGQHFGDLNIVKAKDPVTAQAGANTAPVDSSSGQMSQSGAVGTSPLWSVRPPGVLQRSFDDGNTWQRVNPAENRDAAGPGQATRNPKPDAAINPAAVINSPAPVFRAVAVSGADVWAGGSAGVLYHTPDGNRWTRVIPSEATATLMGDIIGIQFADSQHGKISTSTGEVWTTADGGQSWQKRP